MAKSLHTPEYEKFRLYLLNIRESRQLSQAEVAARLNSHQSFIAKYERGERRIDVIEFIRICKALDIDPQNALSDIIKRIDSGY